MNSRTLRILGALALIGLVLAWWLARPAADEAAGAGGKSDAVLAGYREKINDVVRLELDDGKEPMRLEKRGTVWVDTTRGGYPVKTEEVKRLLRELNALQKKEAKTARPELHGQLQLALEGDEETRGKVLRLWATSAENSNALSPAQPDWELVIGKAKWSPVRGLYVRLLNEDQCWFAAGELQLPYAPTAWFEKEIVDLSQEAVAKVVLVRGGETFTIARPDAATPWALAELPEGRALLENSPFNALAGTLGYLNFDDVAPAADPRFARDPDLVAEFVCFNGASIRGTGWTEGEDLWMRFEAAPPTAAAPPPAVPPAAEPPAGEEAPADQDANAPAAPAGPSAEQIASWSGRFTGWTYKLSPWKVRALQQPVEDWLEPVPAPEAPPEPAPEEPAPEEPPPADGND